MSKFNGKSKIGEVLKDERAVEILKRYKPDILENSMLDMAKSFPIELATRYASFIGISKDTAQQMIDEICGIE